ncbi:LIM and senescent cell antigen-like-containing domain protein 1 [Ixodes scapularis]
MPLPNTQLKLDASELYHRRTEHLSKVMEGLSPEQPRVSSDSYGSYANLANNEGNASAADRTPPRPTGRGGPVSSSTPKSPMPARSSSNAPNQATSSLAYPELMACAKCGEGFGQLEKIVNSCGQIWHPECFVCAQCFRRFPDDVYYEFEGRNYCEYDFRRLFIPMCAQCMGDISGRLIRALGRDWHADCLRCKRCKAGLSDTGLVSIHRRPYCRQCYKAIQAEDAGKLTCAKCEEAIDGAPLRHRGDVYHPYHFNCAKCGAELTPEGREVSGELHCVKCRDKMATSVCAACRRPIEDTRVVCALGKKWHVEHFVCAQCEKPFNGRRHYEKKGHAYCETHFEQLFGYVCFVCNLPSAQGYKSLNKMWCPRHFCCSYCDRSLSDKSRFFDIDLRPVCKKCYEKFPSELRKRLMKSAERSPFNKK